MQGRPNSLMEGEGGLSLNVNSDVNYKAMVLMVKLIPQTGAR